MTRLYLLRHGESEANVAGTFSSRLHDVALSARGRIQAEQQARRLAAAGVAALYSSPLRRARETAACVSHTTGLPPVLHEALLELDIGELDGRKADEGRAWDIYEGVRRRWEAGEEEAGFEGGEALTDVAARLAGFLEGLPLDPGGPVVLVGHGMLFMALLWLFCENRGPTLQANYMERGHLSLLRGEEHTYRIEVFGIAPED